MMSCPVLIRMLHPLPDMTYVFNKLFEIHNKGNCSFITPGIGTYCYRSHCCRECFLTHRMPSADLQAEYCPVTPLTVVIESYALHNTVASFLVGMVKNWFMTFAFNILCFSIISLFIDPSIFY